MKGEQMEDLWRLLNCAATIRPFTYRDRVTGQKVSVSISPYYTVLAVDSREYYFNRDTGEFDGTSVTVEG
jgi:hypothetical protein